MNNIKKAFTGKTIEVSISGQEAKRGRCFSVLKYRSVSDGQVYHHLVYGSEWAVAIRFCKMKRKVVEGETFQGRFVTAQIL